jgi:hypothetical protein
VTGLLADRVADRAAVAFLGLKRGAAKAKSEKRTAGSFLPFAFAGGVLEGVKPEKNGPPVDGNTGHR